MGEAGEGGGGRRGWDIFYVSVAISVQATMKQHGAHRIRNPLPPVGGWWLLRRASMVKVAVRRKQATFIIDMIPKLRAKYKWSCDGRYLKIGGHRYHRIAVAWREGRPLTSKEHVHHLDHDPLNNALSNLKVEYVDQHLKLHASEGGRAMKRRPRKKRFR